MIHETNLQSQPLKAPHFFVKKPVASELYAVIASIALGALTGAAIAVMASTPIGLSIGIGAAAGALLSVAIVALCRFHPINPVGADNKPIHIVPFLHRDEWNEVLSKSQSDLVALSCVSHSFNELTKTYAEKITPEGCFGVEKWKKYKVKVDVESVPIPLKMIQDFDPSMWMLTLVLENINGEPLTLTSIDRFVSDCKNGKDAFKSNYRNLLSDDGIEDKTVKPFKAYWVMLSKDVLGGTRNKNFEDNEEMVKKAGYEIPTLIDVVVSVFLHNLDTGAFVLPDGYDAIFTRVQDRTVRGVRISIGGFSALGLYVHSCLYGGAYFGACYARKSLAIGH